MFVVITYNRDVRECSSGLDVAEHGPGVVGVGVPGNVELVTGVARAARHVQLVSGGGHVQLVPCAGSHDGLSPFLNLK